MDPHNHPTNASNNPSPPSGIAQDPSRHDGSHSSVPTEPAGAAQQPLDSRMDTDEDGDMPGLRSVSDEDDDMPGLQDVSDSSDDDDDEDDDESHDVEMRPPSTRLSSLLSSSTRPASSTSTNSNRRARVEEDDDTERDRRHPSERTSSHAVANNGQLAPSHSIFRIRMTTSTGEPIGRPIPLQHSINAAGDTNPGNNNNNVNAPGSAANPTPNPAAAGDNRPRPPHSFLNFREPNFAGLNVNGPGGGIFIGGGMMSIPLRGMANQNAPGGQPPAPGAAGDAMPALQDFALPTGDNGIEELLSAVGLSINQALGGAAGAGAIPININLGNFAFGLEEKEDPERAKKLVEGLEDVPVGLVKRLVRVGGTGGGMGEDDSKGGDAGCAICWDNLLDAEGEGFGKPEPVAASAADEANAESSSSKPEVNQPRIVSLPCAHVFHADCLIPWFSRPRQTTCPTCRFNIDPDNLTYVSAARRERDRRAAQAAARAANPDAPVADAPAPPEANANPAAPAGNPPAPGSPANDPLPGLRVGQSITMEMVFGVPMWPPLGQPGAPPLPTEAGQAGPANQANNGEAQAAAGAGDDQAPPESARDVLRRESERHFHEVIAQYAMARGRPPAPPGGNAQGNAGGDVNADGEAEHMQEEPPAERPHRASSAPPPSTVPLPRASAPAQQGAAAAAGPASPPPPGATSPRGTQLPPFLPNLFHTNLFNTPAGGPPRNPPFLAGTQTLNEAVNQMIGALLGQFGPDANPPPAAPGQPSAPEQGGVPAAGPAEGGEPAAVPTPAPAPAAPTLAAAAAISSLFASSVFAPPAAPPAQPNNAPTNNGNPGPTPNVPPFRLSPFPFFAEPMGARPDPNRPKPTWTLPLAPGPTLRQRIERREREAGLRCYDVSCGIGPSDEEPELSETIVNLKQLSIKGADGAEVCAHRFHTACLVSAERVAMAAHSAELVCKDGSVEVSCPVCRGAGSVTEEEWTDGVATLG